MTIVHNPILPGFYPDPSICAVGRDFYLVNSTFAYFPGVPIFHSRDLAHWRQIGNVLTRPSQLPLDGCRHSRGIYAPTLRYHDGTFYLITTNISGGGNFIVTARDPAGPWSEPYWLGDAAPGIDPSLLFDDDGRCYYVGNRPNPDGERYGGDWEIWAQELDLNTMRLTGESHALWKGALRDVIWPEGPHLYKKDGMYYLMIAEGGTGPNHSVSVARSEHVFGPYVGNPNNPILTHRHLGAQYPVTCVGHGDLAADAEGNWYMVMLGMRPCGGHTIMGRETFLARVEWQNGWPVVTRCGKVGGNVPRAFGRGCTRGNAACVHLRHARAAAGVSDPARSRAVAGRRTPSAAAVACRPAGLAHACLRGVARLRGGLAGRDAAGLHAAHKI